jgi:hypothetical protein
MAKPLESDHDELSTLPVDLSPEDVVQLPVSTPHDPDIDDADRLEKADEIADDVEADADDLTQLPE